MVEVLLSCMDEEVLTITNKSNLHHDVLVVNQCDCDIERKKEYPNNITVIDTPTRGLSISRNIALKNARGEICVLADDDEVFENDYYTLIEECYSNNPNADIIIFKIGNISKGQWDKPKRIRGLEALKIGSWQISFRLNSIQKIGVSFDVKMGSGTGNGGGEENKFILDCMKSGLKVYYQPIVIANMEKTQSQWFTGFDEEYFYTRGSSTRYLLGLPLSLVYAIYYLIKKRNLYKSSISSKNALKYLVKGIVDNKIAKE